MTQFNTQYFVDKPHLIQDNVIIAPEKNSFWITLCIPTQELISSCTIDGKNYVNKKKKEITEKLQG